jgi:hypothetical protein
MHANAETEAIYSAETETETECRDKRISLPSTRQECVFMCVYKCIYVCVSEIGRGTVGVCACSCRYVCARTRVRLCARLSHLVRVCLFVSVPVYVRFEHASARVCLSVRLFV